MASTSTTADHSTGDFSPEGVPVVEPGALALVLPQPAQTIAAEELALGDLLSDALFGDVIDISDLIPRIAPASVEAVAPELPLVQIAGTDDVAISSGELAAPAVIPLTIIYDEDLLAGSSF